MAQIAKHSTTDEAIRVGKEMRAKHVILTHFSRRYPIIPCLRDLKDTKNVAVAMDFLQVVLCSCFPNQIGYKIGFMTQCW